MPDITMCPSRTCPIKETCVRSPESGTKADKFRQSWFVNDPYESNDPTFCSYYWPVMVQSKEAK